MSFSADCFDEPFDVEEYIERLTWRAQGGGNRTEFNARQLYEVLSNHLDDLKILDEKLENKAQKLEKQLEIDAQEHVEQLVALQSQHQEAFSCFKELDEKINTVATKVVYLGEQLEATNQPRKHAEEALKLMKHFEHFRDNNSEELNSLFGDPSRLADAADIIRKLKLISNELNDEKFKNVKERINLKYSDVEKSLVRKFQESTQSNDKANMKIYADILSNFKGYQKCIEEFIETTIMQVSRQNSEGIFDQILDFSIKIEELSKDVFNHPEHVVQKFLQVVYKSEWKKYQIFR